MAEPRRNSGQGSGFAVAYYAAGLFLILAIIAIYAADQLIPIAIAVMVWFLINALADAYDKTIFFWIRLPKLISLLLSLVTICGVSVLIVNAISDQVTDVAADAPKIRQRIGDLSQALTSWLGMEPKRTLESLLQPGEIRALFAEVGRSIGSLTTKLGLVLIYVIFLIADQHFFPQKLARAFPDKRRHEEVQGIISLIQKDIKSYLWIMTASGLIIGAATYGVLTYFGYKNPVFWAFIMFLLSYIPTVGVLVGVVSLSLFGLVQFDSYLPAFAAPGVIFAVNVVIANLLAPKLAGDRLNLSQFVVIASIFLWGSVWGVAGMLLSVPIMSILLIVLSHIKETRPVAVILSQRGQLPKHASQANEVRD